MKLTVLGSGVAISGPERATTGFALHMPNETIVIDLGFGCFKNLEKAGIDYTKVNKLFFTHFEHPDHISDLLAFLFVRKIPAAPASSQINIFGGPGFSSAIGRLLSYSPFFEVLPFKLNVVELEPFSTKVFSGFSLTTKPVSHEPSSLGLKFKVDQKTVVFFGDTGPNENLVDLAKDADLLVTECSNVTKKEEIHLNTEQVAEIASRAKLKQLLLTHFYQEAEKADLKALVAKKFKGEIHIGKDLMQVSV